MDHSADIKCGMRDKGEGGVTRNKRRSWSEKFAQIPQLKTIGVSLLVSWMLCAAQIWWAARDSKTQMEV